MAYTGRIRFISEDNKRAIVEEFSSAANYSLGRPEGHKVLGAASYAGKAREDIFYYTYNSLSDFNDGRDITFSLIP